MAILDENNSYKSDTSSSAWMDELRIGRSVGGVLTQHIGEAVKLAGLAKQNAHQSQILELLTAAQAASAIWAADGIFSQLNPKGRVAFALFMKSKLKDPLAISMQKELRRWVSKEELEAEDLNVEQKVRGENR